MVYFNFLWDLYNFIEEIDKRLDLGIPRSLREGVERKKLKEKGKNGKIEYIT
jgi:hypothetical protein